jgi:mannan endo-1,4-beta-mannosidase
MGPMRLPAVAFVLSVLFVPFLPGAESHFHDFITARDGQLFEGGKPFRFISFNIPNLTYTEDDMRFEQLSSFRWPTPYEIDDALATIQQMGGRVARTYVLSIRKTNDPPDLPRHILGPGRLNEEAMVVLDRVLESANRHGVRLIIPLVDQASWWGGIEEMAAWHGKPKDAFFTDSQLKEDYKQLAELVLNRVNTRTGVRHNEDKAVLAWELGNELKAPKDWVAEMAPVIKAIAPKQLVAESYFTANDNPGVDLVQDHLYQGDPEKMIAQIRDSVKRNAGRKVYMVGEFGFISTERMRAVMDTAIHEPAVAGALIWSLRFHNEDGGYYWHHEPFGGDFFKAYHWPGGPAGEPYDETRFMRIVREKAHEIQNRPAPPLDAPAAPDLFRVSDGGIVTWRGATGAVSYDLQRADEPRGPWQTVAWQLTDDAAQYRPLAVDEFAQPGRTYRYRIVARNEAGLSRPSHAFGPVTLRCRTLVDELRNLSLTYRKSGKLELKRNNARNYKEDGHRLWGSPGAWIAYHVSGRVTAMRVWAFGEQGEPGLEFRVGCDGEKGATLAARTQDFNGGKDMYDFRWPRLYTLAAPPGTGPEVTILFQRETQIARVEIEYE